MAASKFTPSAAPLPTSAAIPAFNGIRPICSIESRQKTWCARYCRSDCCTWRGIRPRRCIGKPRKTGHGCKPASDCSGNLRTRVDNAWSRWGLAQSTTGAMVIAMRTPPRSLRYLFTGNQKKSFTSCFPNWPKPRVSKRFGRASFSLTVPENRLQSLCRRHGVRFGRGSAKQFFRSY